MLYQRLLRPVECCAFGSRKRDLGLPIAIGELLTSLVNGSHQPQNRLVSAFMGKFIGQKNPSEAGPSRLCLKTCSKHVFTVVYIYRTDC